MQLVDSHCHLDDRQFDPDRETIIQRARDVGLEYMLSIGTGDGPPDLERAIRLAEKYPFVYATAGVHPNDAEKVASHTFSCLSRLLEHPKVVALGEIGLDYHWGVPKHVQERVFLKQLEIAAQAGMPVIIHTRNAWDDTIALLRQHWAPTHLPCLMHCFTGNPDQARECLDLGFHLAFGGVATYPKASDVRAAVSIVPTDRLLLETDAPYLAPVPHRGRRNEPAYITHTAQTLAELRGVSPGELAAATTANFRALFLDRSTATERLN